MKAGGIVLCGGRSSRMGRPKAWLPIRGRTCLQHVVDIVAQVVDPIVVVAAPGQSVPPLPEDVQRVDDPVEGRGPLQGLAAGLEILRSRVDAAYLSSCDVPFLQPALIRLLLDALEGYDVAVPHAHGYYHPLATVYHTRVADEVVRLLEADRLRPAFLFEAVPTRVLSEDELFRADPDLRSLRNLNTPEDYAAALRDLE